MLFSEMPTLDGPFGSSSLASCTAQAKDPPPGIPASGPGTCGKLEQMLEEDPVLVPRLKVESLGKLVSWLVPLDVKHVGFIPSLDLSRFSFQPSDLALPLTARLERALLPEICPHTGAFIPVTSSPPLGQSASVSAIRLVFQASDHSCSSFLNLLQFSNLLLTVWTPGLHAEFQALLPWILLGRSSSVTRAGSGEACSPASRPKGKTHDKSTQQFNTCGWPGSADSGLCCGAKNSYADIQAELGARGL